MEQNFRLGGRQNCCNPSPSQIAPRSNRDELKMTAVTQAKDEGWHEAVIRAFKDNEVRIVIYVPDNVLRPLIEAVTTDDYFTAFATTREEEAIGIVCGAAMAGGRGIVLMQTSG